MKKRKRKKTSIPPLCPLRNHRITRAMSTFRGRVQDGASLLLRQFQPPIERDLVDLVDCGVMAVDENWVRDMPIVASIRLRNEDNVVPFK